MANDLEPPSEPGSDPAGDATIPGNHEAEVRALTLAVWEREALFRQFAEASSDVLWMRDAATLDLQFVSPAFEAMFGAPRSAISNPGDVARLGALILPEDRDLALANIARAAGGEAVVHEFRIRRPSDGAVHWIRNTDFPLLDAQGRTHRAAGIATDVTAAREAMSHQETLLAELQHRTRNLLGVVRSMARRTADTSADLDAFLTHFDGRLAAVARAQSAITRNPDVAVRLDALVLEEFVAAAGSEQLTLGGPDVVLTGKAAESLSLALHELATNAVKYGALSIRSGHVAVTWDVHGAGPEARLVLDWREHGVSVIDPEPRRRGFGRRLLEEALPYDMGAQTRLTFAPGGLHATIETPLPPGAAPRNAGD